MSHLKSGIKTGLLSPNTMGFFAFFPFMQCYHEIVCMSHSLCGTLRFNNSLIDFSGGKGYIEKDWGSSFPKEYVWIQCNNFEKSNAGIMCSIAHIPFIGLSFRGFICNLSIGGREYRFATYNNSKIKNMQLVDGLINICLEKGPIRLEINVRMPEQGILKAPKKGAMSSVIKEGLSGVVEVSLVNSAGDILFRDKGHCCGVEWVKQNK